MVVSHGNQVKKPKVVEEVPSSEEEESRSKTETDDDGDPNMSTYIVSHTDNISSEEEDGDYMDDNFEDGNDGNGSEENDDDGETENASSGLANVMARILATKERKQILSKAKKDWEIKDKGDDSDDDSYEVVDSSGHVKKELSVKVAKKERGEALHLQNKRKLRKLWDKRFRVKPNLEQDHEKERKLKVLATQGVVQLFSAVEKHRNMLQKKLSETRSVMGREKVLESAGREAFMEVLRGQGQKLKRSVVTKDEPEIKTEVKEEVVEAPDAKKPKWNVFSDNFYGEPTLQGWDQQSDED